MRMKSSVRIVMTIIMKVVPLIRLRLSTRYLQLLFLSLSQAGDQSF
jgi:hypothetical protein